MALPPPITNLTSDQDSYYLTNYFHKGYLQGSKSAYQVTLNFIQEKPERSLLDVVEFLTNNTRCKK
jgi:hypothetical protein